MTSFFKSQEYLDYKKVHARIQQPGGNTINNLNIFLSLFAKAIELATNKYNNIGWDYINGGYKWHTSPKLSEPNYTDDDVYFAVHGKNKNQQMPLL